MNQDRRPFSRRHGHSARDREITIRADAPQEFREALLYMATEVGLGPSDLRRVVCQVLRRAPDPSNWSDYPNVWEEVLSLVSRCEWFRVYDIAEAIYELLARRGAPHRAGEFETLLNEHFREAGIGWQLTDGRINARGTEAFEIAVHQAVEVLDSTGRQTASSEIHEAIHDLSRRPEPDVTGAIQHGMAALECVARDICGDPKRTLGDLLKQYPGNLGLPKPLDEAVAKAWGYASEMGRHVREGRVPEREEAELVVGLTATIATYLSRKSPRTTILL